MIGLDNMASATKFLLTFEYQAIARIRTRNIKVGLRSIAIAQLDAQLWRSRRRRRWRKKAKRKSP